MEMIVLEKEIQLIPAKKKSRNAGKEAVKKLRVAAYCRVSTDHEEQEGSYKIQVEHYENYINSHPEWELAGVYADEGISGLSTKNRASFKKMIKDCHAGKIDMIITKSISRFARNTVDCLRYIRELKSMQIPVIFESENINTCDAKGDVLPSEMIQCSDRCNAARPLGIWALGQWLPLGGLLFCPEVGGDRAAGVHTLLTMNTLLTIAWGIVKRVWAIVNRVYFSIEKD